jgi:hypothetical protein
MAGLQLRQEREQNTPLCGAFPKNLFWTDAVAPWSGGEGRRLIDTRPTCRILNTPRTEPLSLDLGTDHCSEMGGGGTVLYAVEPFGLGNQENCRCP